MLAGLDRIVETMSAPWALWQRLDTKARNNLLNIFGVRLVITPDGGCRNAHTATGCMATLASGVRT